MRWRGRVINEARRPPMKVEQLCRDVQQVGVGKHVETVAQEHEDHGCDAEPRRRQALPPVTEHYPKGHHHQEDGEQQGGPQADSGHG